MNLDTLIALSIRLLFWGWVVTTFLGGFVLVVAICDSEPREDWDNDDLFEETD